MSFVHVICCQSFIRMIAVSCQPFFSGRSASMHLFVWFERADVCAGSMPEALMSIVGQGHFVLKICEDPDQAVQADKCNCCRPSCVAISRREKACSAALLEVILTV